MNTLNHITLNGVTKYVKDSACQAMLAPEELTLTAANAHAVGDLFRYDGKLYKASAAIGVGDTIDIGVNCEETTVAGERIDVQVNGVSIAANGVANIPVASNDNLGVVKFNPGQGILRASDNSIAVNAANDNNYRYGNDALRPTTTANQHKSVFYGLAKAAGDITQAASDNAVGTYTDEAKAAIRTMVGAVGTTDYASTSTAGVVKVSLNNGSQMINNVLTSVNASAAEIKTGVSSYKQVNPGTVDAAAFYGLAKAAGDTTQSASSNAVGQYTDNAKASIKSMLGIIDGSTGTVDISGTTPTITAVENTRYVCGEVTSLSFTPPSSGISIVRFTSGSTVTVLTLPSTVKFPEWFDPTTLETNTIYEICITDGIYGAVMSWAQ